MRIFCGVLIAIAAVLALYILILTIAALAVNPKKRYTHNNRLYRFILNKSTLAALKLLRIKVTVTGKEQLPADERFLFVCNHRSNFDPLITWSVLEKYDLAFISKPENFKIPFFGRIIRKCCFMPIDRENPKNAIKVIRDASSLIKSGEVSVAVYPEGTRSKTCTLLPFHSVMLKIAQQANAPIAVSVITGTEAVHKNIIRRKSRVELKVVEVLPAETVKNMKTADLGDYIYSKMQENLKEG